MTLPASIDPITDHVVAGNGLLDRRVFLGAATAFATLSGSSQVARAQMTNSLPPWMQSYGAPFRPYGAPSAWEKEVVRKLTPMAGTATVGTSRTPLERLAGTITPNGLHFERHHNGVPDIPPAEHRLFIHGLVERPLRFTVDALMRYPMESAIRFIECGGNSSYNSRADAPQMSAGMIHGLVSCAEWTGVRLATLLDEAGVDPAASWVVAEGADSAAMSRSIPIEKCMDDAIVALYQNGEALRPEQGYPMRLLLPGFEGNTQVKWLRRLQLVSSPAHTRDETSHYTDLRVGGRADQFVLPVRSKSVILKPSFGLSMHGPGLYEISGLAWTGGGRIAKVEVSADGGKSWAEADLGQPVLPKALTRFRLAWSWAGQRSVLMSRATDETGDVQPSHREWTSRFAPGQPYHNNSIQAWLVDEGGIVTNVYI